MPYSKNSDFTYSICGLNKIVEERGNQFIRFARIAWGTGDNKKEKYDIRKYVTGKDGNEQMLKGLSFLTDNGPHELTHILLRENFGNTTEILNIIKDRKDFPEAVQAVYGDKVKNENFVDLRDIIK